MQEEEHSCTTVFPVSLLVVAIDWLNVWEQENSWFMLCSGGAPALPGLRTCKSWRGWAFWVLCDPVVVVGPGAPGPGEPERRGPERRVQPPGTDNRWGDEPGFSLRRISLIPLTWTLFHISQTVCFPALGCVLCVLFFSFLYSSLLSSSHFLLPSSP